PHARLDLLEPGDVPLDDVADRHLRHRRQHPRLPPDVTQEFTRMMSCWYGAMIRPEMRRSSTRNRRVVGSSAVHAASRSRSSSVRTTTPSAPTAAPNAAKSTSGISIGASARPFNPYRLISAP